MDAGVTPSLRITAEDLAAAASLPTAGQGIGNPGFGMGAVNPESQIPTPSRRSSPWLSPIPLDAPRRVNRLAIASLIVAVLGIPLFGLLTGVVAIVLGSIALGAIHQARGRGTALALTAVLLGVADVVGWAIFLALVLGHPPTGLELTDFDPDPAALENLPPRLNRASARTC